MAYVTQQLGPQHTPSSEEIRRTYPAVQASSTAVWQALGRPRPVLLNVAALLLLLRPLSLQANRRLLARPYHGPCHPAQEQYGRYVQCMAEQHGLSPMPLRAFFKHNAGSRGVPALA